MNAQALIRAFHLASPALPVGAYSYSQGLEMAVEEAWVTHEASAKVWIHDALEWNVSQWELPLVGALMEAWLEADEHGHAGIERWNAEFLASRETAELRLETVQMGFSARKLLPELYPESARQKRIAAWLETWPEVVFPVAWTALAHLGEIDKRSAMTAYLWGWLENQVMAAVKLIPLGQSAGQRLLSSLGSDIEERVEMAFYLPEEAWSNYAPGLSLLSARHETQYSRLFRS